MSHGTLSADVHMFRSGNSSLQHYAHVCHHRRLSASIIHDLWRRCHQ